MVYEPKEDSYLLLEQVKKYAKGNVLEIGTGKGLQAVEAAKKAEKVIATDVDDEAIKISKERAKKENVQIEFLKSDLFEKVEGKYDLIIFNAPYLPTDKRDPDVALDGGKHGYELLQKFLDDVDDYMVAEGKALIVFSSKTNKRKVHEILDENLLEYKEAAKKTVFFEDIYVYLVWKSDLLKEFEKKELFGVKYLAKGKRSKVYSCNDKKYCIKVEDSSSGAINRAVTEAKWLKKLNQKGIGPKLIDAEENYIVMEYVEGERIDKFLETEKDKQKIFEVVLEVLGQCKELDDMNVTKEEMHRPFKHIIVGEKPVMIDFERCHTDLNSKNVTQFLDYLTSGKTKKLLRDKGIRLDKKEVVELSKNYKDKKDKETFNLITQYLNSQKNNK